MNPQQRPVAPTSRATLGTGSGHDRGYAFVDLPFSLSTTSVGVDVFAQWLALDPVSSTFAATEFHALRGQ